MNVLNALVGFDGRISRRTFWLAFALIVVVFGVGRYVLKQATGDESFGLGGPIVVAWSALAAFPLTVIAVKRLNDRGRPAWLGVAYGAATALFIVAPSFGYFGDIATLTPAEHVMFWPLLALTVFVLFEAGFRASAPSPLVHDDAPLR